MLEGWLVPSCWWPSVSWSVLLRKLIQTEFDRCQRAEEISSSTPPVGLPLLPCCSSTAPHRNSSGFISMCGFSTLHHDPLFFFLLLIWLPIIHPLQSLLTTLILRF